MESVRFPVSETNKAAPVAKAAVSAQKKEEKIKGNREQLLQKERQGDGKRKTGMDRGKGMN